MNNIDLNQKGGVGDFLKEKINENSTIHIPSNLFTIYAFDELKEALNKTKNVKFLFNEPTFIKKIQNVNKEVKEFKLQMKNRERSVSEFDLEIGLKNNLDQNQIAEKCAKFISSKMEVKSTIINDKININSILLENENNDNYLIQGQNINFSTDGLGYSNKIRFDFNTAINDETTLKRYKEMFNQIWNDASLVEDVKNELLSHIQNLYKENSPELVYYVTLYNLFSEKLINMDDMARLKEKTGIVKTKVWNSLYNFQHDAVVGAIKKLELYNGCIIADSVGLGKTFEALAIIKYYELRNDRVLVLSPKKLRNNWLGFKQNSTTNILAEDRFNFDLINHTDLSRENGYTGDIDLSKINWGNYDLVVIDESHNFRNNPARKDRKTRYEKLMDDIIKTGVKTKVLMLSATPVNNRLADLKNQVMFITEGKDDAFNESVGITSIEKTLRLAQYRFGEWAKLPKEDQTTSNLLPMLDYNFFNLLNTVTIARSRKHIQKYYDTKDIGKFPTRLKPITIKSDIDTSNNFPELSHVNGLISRLNLAIYSPLKYLLPTKIEEYEEKYKQTVKEGKSQFKQSDREQSLVYLIRTNILKRLESSINSFKLTIERILNQVNNMLDLVNNMLITVIKCTKITPEKCTG